MNCIVIRQDVMGWTPITHPDMSARLFTSFEEACDKIEDDLPFGTTVTYRQTSNGWTVAITSDPALKFNNIPAI